MQNVDRIAHATLRQHFAEITGSGLDPGSLARELYQANIINPTLLERASNGLFGTQDRLSGLLSAVMSHGRQGVFQKFVGILQNTAHSYLGDNLIATYRSNGGWWVDHQPQGFAPTAAGHYQQQQWPRGYGAGGFQPTNYGMPMPPAQMQGQASVFAGHYQQQHGAGGFQPTNYGTPMPPSQMQGQASVPASHYQQQQWPRGAGAGGFQPTNYGMPMPMQGQASVSDAPVPLTDDDVTDVCDILRKAGFKDSQWDSLAARLRIKDPGSITHRDLALRLEEVLRQWINDVGQAATWEKLATQVSKVSGYGEGTKQTILGLAAKRGTQSQQQQATQNVGGGVAGVGGPQMMHPGQPPVQPNVVGYQQPGYYGPQQGGYPGLFPQHTPPQQQAAYQQQTQQPMGGVAGPQMNPGFGAMAHSGMVFSPPQGNQPSVQQQHTMSASMSSGATQHTDTAIVAPPQAAYQQQTQQPMGGVAWSAGPQMNPGFVPPGAMVHGGMVFSPPQGNQPSVQQQHTMSASMSGGATQHTDTAIVAPPQVEPNWFPEQDRERRVAPDGKTFYNFYKAFPRDPMKNMKLSFGPVQPQQGTKQAGLGEYGMERPTHGICLIINNEEFQELREREGTEVDEKNLVQLWRYLGYDVIVHRDRTAHQMEEIFEGIKNQDHSSSDSFVCCILSHGVEGQIYGSDDKMIKIEDITAKLNGNACATLNDKPKMFFIQACRGKGRDTGTRVASDSDEAVTKIEKSAIPSDFNFFFGYATPPKRVAWRDLDNGSWYISELCRGLCSYANHRDLLSIMTHVHHQVGTQYKKDKFRQAPEYTSRLCKDVYFF